MNRMRMIRNALDAYGIDPDYLITLSQQPQHARLEAIRENLSLVAALRELYMDLTWPCIADDDALWVQRLALAMLPRFAHVQQEELWVAGVAVPTSAVWASCVYRGSAERAPFRVAEVLRPVLVRKSPVCVLIHNHPSGNPQPSPEDIMATTAMHGGCTMMGIELLDHIIIGADRWVSLRHLRIGPWVNEPEGAVSWIEQP